MRYSLRQVGRKAEDLIVRAGVHLLGGYVINEDGTPIERTPSQIDQAVDYSIDFIRDKIRNLRGRT